MQIRDKNKNREGFAPYHLKLGIDDMDPIISDRTVRLGS